MTELAPLEPGAPDLPLSGLTVLEVQGELTAYAGRLLADLGADVVLLHLEPDAAADAFSPEAWFLHRGKREVRVDGDSPEADAAIAALVAAADVVLQPGGADNPAPPPALETEAVRAANPRAVHAILTPFGLQGPASRAASTDLVRLAAGGLLWLGGYPDAEPIAPFGGQSAIATAIYGAVAVLLALVARQRSGAGETIEVSAQEVLTHALETSIAEFELLDKVRRRLGSVPREAGTGVFPCSDGYVSIVAGRLGTAGAWKRLTEWLLEAGAPETAELLQDGWDTLPFRQRPGSIARFSEIFSAFAAEHGKDALYREAQRRSIALAPVNEIDDLLADRQLASRRFFRETLDDRTGTRAVVPSPPFRLSPACATNAAVDASLAPAVAVVRRPT